MNVQYEYFFTLPRNIVWKYIKDEKVLINAIPGCKTFEEISKGVYGSEVQINIGPIKDSFNFKVLLDEEKAPDFFCLKLKGEGNMGEISGDADLWLTETQGTTKLICKVETQMTGTLVLAGQQILNSGINKGLDIFFQKLEKEIKRNIYKLRRRSR